MASDATSQTPAAGTSTTTSQSLSSGFLSLLAVSLVVSIGVPWSIWWMLQEPEQSPYEKTQEALEMLEEGRPRSAYLIAIKMLKERIADPDIGGALEFVVGVAHFRKAERVTSQSEVQAKEITTPIYDLAMKYLVQANQKTLYSELKPEWAYVLGSCYFELNRFYKARELLETAFTEMPSERPDIMLKLAICYRDPNVLQASLKQSTNRVEADQVRRRVLQRISDVLANLPADASDFSEEKRLHLRLLEAEFDLLTDLDQQMVSTLEDLDFSPLEATESAEKIGWFKDRVVLLQARAALAQGDPATARGLLETLIEHKSGLEISGTMQAEYFIGLAYEMDGRYDLAIDHLAKPAAITESDISFPANLHAGQIARKRGLHEEALDYYLTALSQIGSTQTFTNRWINLQHARDMIQLAWDEWSSSGRYEHFRFATVLAENSSLLFTQAYADQLIAVVSRKRAEFIQQEHDAQIPNVSPETAKRTVDHWKRAGQAYARLANSTQASDLYSQNLWESSLLYRRGNDFVNSLKMVNMFIDSNPRTGLPAAYILQSRLLMDLDPYSNSDDLSRAITILERLIRNYPKDQVIYEAQMLLGKAYLEADQTDLAVEIWRGLLLESPLTPAATEWQGALFALGRTLFLVSDTRPDILLADRNEPLSEEQQAINFEHVDEAIHWLDEFVRRNPQHPRAQEARWLLAKGLRFRMQKPAQESRDAETENTQNELNKEIHDLAKRAIEQFELLKAELKIVDQKDLLDDTTTQFFRDAYFEPAHIQYQLGRYDDTGDAYRQAIDLYSNAAFRFTGEPIILIAYYRIAECYRELNAQAEARRQLEQARVILSQLEEPFSDRFTNFDRQQWEQLLEQSIRLYDLVLDSQANPQ